MNVTNGIVEYERVVKPADYESKRFKVSLSFAIDDGADAAAATAKIGDLVVAEVHRRLGLPAPAAVAERELPPELPKQGRRARTPPPAEAVPQANPTEPSASSPHGSTVTASTPAAHDPAAIEPADGDDGWRNNHAADPAAISEPEPASPTQVDETPPVVTDADLHRATEAVVAGRKKTATAIKAKIDEMHGVVGKSMRLFDQAQRRAFLNWLKEAAE